MSEPGWREIVLKTNYYSPVPICSEKRQFALCMSVCVYACNRAAMTGPILMKFGIGDIY